MSYRYFSHKGETYAAVLVDGKYIHVSGIDRINNDTSPPDQIEADQALGDNMPTFPFYSTDAKAALLVLAECRKYGPLMTLLEGGVITYKIGGRPNVKGTGTTDEEAICMLAKSLYKTML